LRPKPSATFTTSPREPSLGTSSFRMTSMDDSLKFFSPRIHTDFHGFFYALGLIRENPCDPWRIF
jgi:hypothetical protein